MPIYEYQCQSCNERTEAIQSFDDPPLAVCPHCGGQLKKLMSAPAFQFKGTGWYVTDYAGKGRPPDGESSAKGESSEKTDKTDKTDKAGKGEKGGSSGSAKESAAAGGSSADG